MRKSSNMPGWRALASWYCCIMGVIGTVIAAGTFRVMQKRERDAK